DSQHPDHRPGHRTRPHPHRAHQTRPHVACPRRPVGGTRTAHSIGVARRGNHRKPPRICDARSVHHVNLFNAPGGRPEIGLLPALLSVVLFLTLVGLWCAVGALLGSHRAVVATLGRVSHWLVPVVFIAVGVLILITSGTLTTIRAAL